MSKTKTKRMVASFLLLCAISGTSVLAMPDDWKPGNDLATTNPDWIDSNNTININDSRFVDQGSETVAPIYIGGSNTTPVNVVFTADTLRFEGNSTPGAGSNGGGAMYFGSPNWAFSDNNQTITIQGISQFIDNSTGSESLVGRTPDGGAIYTTSKMDFIGNASFQGNDALGQPGGENVGGSGGAIYSNAQLNFNDGASFQNNTASTYGGAVYVGNQGELTVTGGATFSGNQAGSQGGAIYNNNKVTLDATGGDITFSNNTVNGVANDIYLADKTNDNPAWGPASDPASLTLKGAGTITFNGSIEGEATTSISNSANKLVLNGDNSGFLGTYKQTAGATTTVGAGGKFFGGNSTISSDSSDTPSNLILNAADALVDGSTITLDGTMYQNYSDVNVYINDDNKINGNISGLGYIYNGDQNSSASTVTLTGDNAGFKGTYFQNSGTGKLVVAENAKSFAGTNIITGSGLELQNGSTLLGQTEITDAAFTSTGATIAGAVDMFGTTKGDMTDTTIGDTFRVVGGTLNLNGGNEISTADGAKGSLVVNGGVVNINQDLTLGGTGNGVITNDAAPENPAQPQINLGAHTLTVNGDTSGYNKNFTANGGTVDINDGGKFFSGTNTFNNNSTVTVDNGELSGTNIFNASTLTANGATISGSIEAETGAEVTIASSTLNDVTFAFDGGTININQDYTINAGDITGTTGTLAQTGDYNLTVNTDVSSFVGTLDKNGGTATVDGQKFFGGQNNIYGGAEVSLSNGAELVAGSTTTLGNDSSSATLNIDGSTVNGSVVANNQSVININTSASSTDSTSVSINSAITGAVDSKINLGKGELLLDADMSGFKGTFKQTTGKTTVNNKFFAGNSIINNGELVFNYENALVEGSKITLNGTVVDDYDDVKVHLNNNTVVNANFEGKGYIYSDKNVTLKGDNSKFTGSYRQENGGKLTVDTGATSFAGTNIITNAELQLNSGSTLEGVTTVNNSTLKSTGAKISGTVDLNGANTKATLDSTAINNTFKITDGALTIQNGSSIGAGGTLDVNGGKVTIDQGLTLGGDNNGVITSSNLPAGGTTGPEISMGNQTLTILGDNSRYQGDFEKTGGNIIIGETNAQIGAGESDNNSSFFSGDSTLTGVTVNMNNNSQIAAADNNTVNLNGSTTINVNNSGLVSYEVDESTGQVTVVSNDNKAVIGGDLDGESTAQINVNGDKTFLQVTGDASGYKGEFSQTSGTTQVTDGAVFFGGDNEVTGGNLIFDTGSKLSSDVVIADSDVSLSINGSTRYTIVNGNEVVHGDGSFILQDVTMQDSLLTGGDEENPNQIYGSNQNFAENAGLASDAHYQMGNGAGLDAHYTFLDNSVAADGSTLVVTNGSDVNIKASVMRDELGSASGFGTDLKGDGVVNTQNTITDKSQALNFTSDNSEFTGEYNHNGGIIQFSGVADNDKAVFFGGTNNINAGTVIFAANSVVTGTNTVTNNANFELTDGSEIDAATTIIDLGSTGNLDITNTKDPIDLNISVGGLTTVDETTGVVSAADINKTDTGALTISADQHTYTGNYTQTGEGKVTVNAGKSFFGGKNNINKGTVDLTAEGVKVAGQNTISSTGDTVGGKMQIGDKTDTKTYLNNPIIVNTVESDTNAGLELVTTDDNDQNLEVAFAIASGADNTGRVTHSGNGTLNLNNAGQNDLFKDFNGTFAQTSTGVTNVFGNSFKNNDIKNGTLNMKNGSTLADGTTNLGDNGTLNIGAFDGDTTFIPEGQEDKYNFDANSTVTINSDIKGTGKVNISDGKTTITALSNNSGLTGTYHQTGGEVVAQSGSTFFGGVNNLIQKGILFFKQGAKLADNSQVKLDGNTYDANDPTAPVDKAILDLDGRTNAVFSGNKLTLNNESATGASFVFTDGILQNAVLHGTQNIAGNVAAGSEPVVTLGSGSGFGNDAEVTIADGAETILASGSVAENGSMVNVDTDSVLGLVSDNLDYYTKTTGDGSIGVTKDPREENAPNINIYNDQSGFRGDYTQDAGRVTVKNGATFFGGTNEVTGTQVTDSTTGEIIKSTSGDLYLEKGSLIGSDIKITNFDKTANAGVSTPHGRVFIEDKIYDKDGNELTDIDKLMDGDLYYNTSADGSAITQHNIKIENAGLILSNGTIFDGSEGPTVFENKGNGGVVDIGFSNGTGVDGDIVLKRDTMLSYGDNAYIKDDSTLEMEDTAILNFINDSTTINYNPEIVGGGSIYKEGLGTTNISSAIDMTGEVNVSEGTLNFTNKDKVIFNSGDDLRQSGNLTVGSGASNANLSIVANETVFGGDVTSNAQDGTQSTVALNGKNTTIGGNLSNTNTNLSILGNSSIGGDWTINGNSGLNLVGNYSNTIDVAGDLILGDNLKDGKLPVAFDYDPHRGTMDTILVDSFQNDSNSPLLITGINFVTSPVDRNFDLSADRLIQQRNPEDTPYYDATSFYANTAMGRYFLSNGAGGADFTGTLVHLNPQQYRGQVATIASWQNQLLINNLLFDHMDIVTRQLMDDEKTANKYAASIPQFAPYQYDLKGGSLWYKAYGNFETLSMTKGLSVGNNAYGALIGADFPLIKLKHGWNVVPTAYIGYNGAHQHFNGVSMYQNGAQLGVMGTAYKGDFLTSLLAYGGGYGNDMSMSGPYGSGSDNTGNWFAGVASKTAYNFHLPADFIFQPTVMAAYNAFGSQNWGSDFGVMSMSSGMLNGLNVAPGFNLIWQKKSFNIYLTAQMVYNIMGGVDGKAGNVDLGYVRMRHSYFEYGLGVSKNFKDRFGGFLQFVIRNGGRTGIGFSGGLQFKVGK